MEKEIPHNTEPFAYLGTHALLSDTYISVVSDSTHVGSHSI